MISICPITGGAYISHQIMVVSGIFFHHEVTVISFVLPYNYKNYFKNLMTLMTSQFMDAGRSLKNFSPPHADREISNKPKVLEVLN